MEESKSKLEGFIANPKSKKKEEWPNPGAESIALTIRGVSYEKSLEIEATLLFMALCA